VTPVNPVVPPTDDHVVVNPPVNQPPVQPEFQPPPAIVDVPPPPKRCNGDCGTEKVPLPPTKPVLVCGEGGPCPEIQPIAGKCDAVQFTGEKKAAKLDIVFVVDTSASLRGGKTKNGGELAQLGRDIGNFVKELDKGVDYNIGVILGHGAGKWNGSLFQSDKGEPVVLKFKEYYDREAAKGGSDEKIRQRVIVAITKDLETKMMNTANEKGGAQGEAMLYSLFQAVNKSSNRNAIAQAGIFRQDAGLSIIMVTDEQDVCFDYTGTEFKPVAKEGFDKKGNPIQDHNEVGFFKSVCSKAFKGGLLHPNNVYDALLALKQNQPLILTGIAYTDVNIPANPDKEDENERGSGVIEFVALGNGPVVDLAKVVRSEGAVSFAPELKHLGQHTEMMMKYENPIKCTTRGIHPDAVDPSTILVTVKNDQGLQLGLFSGGCQDKACPRGVNGWARGSSVRNGQSVYLEVLMHEASLKQIFATARTASGTFNVTFKTKRGIDPRTGKPGTAAN
jgi:hypothetical protein